MFFNPISRWALALVFPLLDIRREPGLACACRLGSCSDCLSSVADRIGRGLTIGMNPMPLGLSSGIVTFTLGQDVLDNFPAYIG